MRLGDEPYCGPVSRITVFHVFWNALARVVWERSIWRTDMVLGRKVAIKVLNQELVHDARFLERFQREARIIAQLSLNPHVVTIYDIGETEDGIP